LNDPSLLARAERVPHRVERFPAPRRPRLR
jgi:hypothetical protein